MSERTNIELMAPVQTSDNPLVARPWGDPAAKHTQNTGILKGGLTNLYLQKNALSGYASYIADSGLVISRASLGAGFDQIMVGNTPIGQTSNYGVLARGKVICDDAMPSADNTIIGVKYQISSTSVVTLTFVEYGQGGAILNSRSSQFSTNYQVISVQQFTLVRYLNPHFTDYQTILLTYVDNISSAIISELWKESASGNVLLPWPLSRPDSFVWAFEASNGWVSGSPNAPYSYVNPAGTVATQLNTNASGKAYCVPALVNGYSAILLTQELGPSGQLFGYLGYNTNHVFSSTMTWANLAAAPIALTGTLPSSDNSRQLGFGYVESNITTTGTGGGNAVVSVPAASGKQADGGSLTGMLASGSIIGWMNHYGRLSGTTLWPSSFPFEIRFGLTNGIQSFLSVANTYSETVLVSAWGPLTPNPFASTDLIDGMAYGNGVFVAVTSTGKIAYSKNYGSSWSSASSPLTGYLQVFFGNGIFVAFGSGTLETVAISTDGISWTSASVGPSPYLDGTQPILTGGYGNGIFCVFYNAGDLTNHVVATSANGVSWTVSAAPTTLFPYYVVYGNGLWVTAGSSGDLWYAASPTGPWTAAVSPFGTSSLNQIAFGLDTFVAVANGGMIAISQNGISWGSLIANPFGTAAITSVTYGSGVFVAATNAGQIAMSTNGGVTWSALLPNSFSSTAYIAALSFGNAYFTAGSSGGSTAVAPPAITVYEDTLGTLLTNPGEIDNSYTPSVIENSGQVGIVYRYNNEYRYIFIGSMSASLPILPPIQKISKNVYKLNTISPGNIVDVSSGTLEISSIDYNGRMLLASTATTQLVAQMINAKYVSSMDVGGRTLSVATSGSGALAFAVKNLVQGTLPNQYEVDYFLSGGSGFNYVQSTSTSGSVVIDLSKVSPRLTYVSSLLIPIGMGYIYGDRFIQDEDSILLLDWFYVDFWGNQHESDLYVIGNEVTNFTVAFQLFGNIYIYDGEIIWLAHIVNNVYVARQQIAIQTGLSFLCAGPDAAFFLSSFDNSVWAFTGSQSVSKLLLFNQLDPILGGAFSVMENTLVLLTATRIVFVRDGAFSTIQPLASDQTALRIFTTENGIIFANNVSSWQYSFNALGAVQPLTWQSAYFGQQGFEKSVGLKFNLTLFDPTKSAQTVTLTSYSYDESGSSSQSSAITINPSDWFANGLRTVRIQPSDQRSLGVSVGLSCASKITLLAASAVFDDDSEGEVPAPWSG